MDEHFETGGGGVVRGNSEAGGDHVGRDQHQVFWNSDEGQRVADRLLGRIEADLRHLAESVDGDQGVRRELTRLADLVQIATSERGELRQELAALRAEIRDLRRTVWLAWISPAVTVAAVVFWSVLELMK